MKSLSRKIAYCATFTAVSIIAIVVSKFLPITLSCLLVCLVCYFLAFRTCGLGYGLLTIAASLILSFALGGLGTVFILNAMLFAPYSLIAYLMNGVGYDNFKGIIRAGVAVVFANAVLAIIYFLLSKYISYDFGAIVDRLGSYAVLAVAVSAAAVATDFLFYNASEYFFKRFK